VLSPLVSMESEKRAVRDFHSPLESEAKGEAFLPLPIPSPTPNLRKYVPKDSKFSKHQRIEISESAP
jgi:hypothetical protein